jgi:hypothetical protein
MKDFFSEGKSFRFYECGSGYCVEKVLTGDVATIGDGVGLCCDNEGNNFLPGTEEFDNEFFVIFGVDMSDNEIEEAYFATQSTDIDDCIKQFEKFCKIADDKTKLHIILVADSNSEQDEFVKHVEAHNLPYTFLEDMTQLAHGYANILVMNTKTFRELSNYQYNIVSRSSVLMVVD